MQYLLRNKISIAIACMFVLGQIKAQKGEAYQINHDDRKLYFGLHVGLTNNIMNFNRSISILSPNPNSVITVYPKVNQIISLGMSSTYRIGKRFLLRTVPSLMVTGRKDFDFKINSPVDLNTYSVKIPSVVLTLPLHIKYESDRYNAFRYTDIMRHYFFMGGKYDYDISSKSSLSLRKDNFSSTSVLGNTINDLAKQSDYGIELGIGTSFFLKYATFSPEVKFSYGLRNLRGSNPILEHFEKITANYISFTIHVEN